MAVSKIKVNTGSLKKDTDSIENHLKNIKSQIKQMKADVKELDSMWDGEANDAFNAAFQSDLNDLDTVCNNIQGIIDYEKNAKKEYDSCEVKVADLVKSITV
ncbi:MAG: WXG100 family type VII secretion target [Bacteroidales bacterium]|nr:WXG100 family type VII secretion target [Clostridium sp.]MCM1204260.1 WXG100 family type VII secretion target [Bacteroidales bacterium]